MRWSEQRTAVRLHRFDDDFPLPRLPRSSERALVHRRSCVVLVSIPLTRGAGEVGAWVGLTERNLGFAMRSGRVGETMRRAAKTEASMVEDYPVR